jgi:hypothetical protein
MKNSKINLQFKVIHRRGGQKNHQIIATKTHVSIPITALLLTPCDSWKFVALWIFICAAGSC